MNCPKCGGEILNDRCMQCGETVVQPPQQDNAQPPQQGYQPPNYQDYQQGYQPPQQQGGYAPPPPPPPSDMKHPKSTTNMVIGIIQCVCCCLITGILMLVWNSNLNTAYRNGDQMEVARLEKNIKIAMIIGFIAPVVLWILYFLLVGVGSLGYMGYYY